MGINVAGVSTSGWFTDNDTVMNFPAIATNGWGVGDEAVAVASRRRSEWSIVPNGNDPKMIRRAFQRINAIMSDLEELYELATLDDTGMISRTSDASWSGRSLTASTGISVSNGDGVSGNPTIGLSHLGLESLTDPDSDRIFFWDDTEDASKWLTASTGLQIVGSNLSTNDSEIVHDDLSGFVANEHVDHSTVTLTVDGTASEITVTGTDGDITTSRTWTVSVPATVSWAGKTVTDLGTVTTADINGGTWQGTIDGNWTATGQTCADLGSVTTVDINGGTINGITDLAVADGGTGASSAADARTNLGLAIGTDVQAWDAHLDDLAAISPATGDMIYFDGSDWVKVDASAASDDDVPAVQADGSIAFQAQAGGSAASDIDSLRDADMALFFLIDADAQAADGYMFDNFNDETQIDATASLNESYDSDGDYYEATDSTSTIDSYSESNQDSYLNTSSSTGAFGQAITFGSEEDIGSVKFYMMKSGSPTGSMYAKIYAATGTVGTDAVPTGSVLATSESVDVSTLTGSFALVEFVFSSAYTASAGDYCIVVEYTSGDDSNYVRGGSDTSSPSHSGNSCYYPGSWSSYTDDMCFYVLGATTYDNLTLISEPRTAAATPTTSRLSVFAEAVDSITINTDLKGYVSEDDGSTWDEVTLAEVSTVGTGDDEDIIQYSGDETLTAGSGTTMVWKVVTDNNKHVRIHAVGQRWRT